MFAAVPPFVRLGEKTDLIGEILVAILRAFLWAFLEAFVPFLIQGVGWLFCFPFRRRLRRDGFAVTMVGVSVWAAVGFAIWWWAIR
jgi:hypothetical protein